MKNLHDVEPEAIDGEDPMGSLKHATVHTNIAGLLKFKCDKKIDVATELSLDISQFDLSKYKLRVKDELEPDIAGYFTLPTIPDGEDDLIKVSQMPDLAIEILSPRQSMSYLVRKIGAYFELGVQSCWLVEPATETIFVYSAPKKIKRFDVSQGEVIDEVLGIHISMKEIF